MDALWLQLLLSFVDFLLASQVQPVGVD
jgi:ABC-type Fe3+-citrate transport system substrate-binding protein